MARLYRPLTAALAAAALSAAALAQDTIKIGEYASLTGKGPPSASPSSGR